MKHSLVNGQREYGQLQSVRKCKCEAVSRPIPTIFLSLSQPLSASRSLSLSLSLFRFLFLCLFVSVCVPLFTFSCLICLLPFVCPLVSVCLIVLFSQADKMPLVVGHRLLQCPTRTHKKKHNRTHTHTHPTRKTPNKNRQTTLSCFIPNNFSPHNTFAQITKTHAPLVDSKRALKLPKISSEDNDY